MLQNGNGVPTSIEEAIKYYKISADKGHKDAKQKLKELNHHYSQNIQ